MLPSMPILFSRESQDAFGNKIEPSTSFFSDNLFQKPPKPPPPLVIEPPKVVEKEIKVKSNSKKTEGKKEPPKTDDNALETALVRSYYTKVQSRFSTHINLPTNKFIQFQNILKCFDPSKESPVDLYRKLEQLFGEDHKDILEEFLLFLKPGQAAEVGRFMDRFMLTQMTGFIEMLQTTLSRKPTVLRKVMRLLTAGANGDGAAMRASVMPHLRSHLRLVQAFHALFPDEKPPASNESGIDILNESFLTDDKGYDEWEFDDPSDNKKKGEATDGIDAVYLHGRVFLQQGRLVRPARVSFPYSKEPYRVHTRRLAPTQPSRHTPPPSDDEKNEKPAKKTKKSPTKTAKDVNDNNSKVKNKGKAVKKDKKSNRVKKEEVKKVKPVLAVKNEMKSSWTREEDKTMLQVMKGEGGSEQTFCRIRELLPHKSVTDIKERFCHVMNLLQQMAVGEVT